MGLRMRARQLVLTVLRRGQIFGFGLLIDHLLWVGLPLSNLHYVQAINWITTESQSSLHTRSTFIEQHIDLPWIFLGLE